MNIPPATLSKKERLSGKSNISNLLSRGKWGSCSGVRYCYLTGTGEPVNRLVVSVPKKFFKRAVKRNLLKRRIRESFRTQKEVIPSCGGTDLLIQYNTSDILAYSYIHALIGQILKQLK